MADFTIGPVNQGTSGYWQSPLTDADGTVLTQSDLTTVTVSLYDQDRDEIINSRDAQNALGVNGFSFTNGQFRWDWTPADVPILDETKALEKHTAMLHFTWAAGTKGMTYEIEMRVRNLRRVA